MKFEAERDALPRLLAFVYAPLGVAAWWAARALLRHPSDRSLCMLLEKTGVACPTCGGTRALLAFGRGDLTGAFVENPLVAAGAALLVLWFLYAAAATALPRLRVTPRLSPIETRGLRLAATAALATTWIYEILRQA
ncbi:MAG: DUF2752 domain-containing protein [bacterium]|nr:DUF2752 domain-containing protein [bacterium]